MEVLKYEDYLIELRSTSVKTKALQLQGFKVL